MCQNMLMRILLCLILSTQLLSLSKALGQRTKPIEPERNVLEGVSEEQLRNEIILPRIDLKYRSGGYLIYDCADQHFVCVDSRGFSQCQLDREFSRENERLILACSPLRRFNTFESCLAELYKLMHQAAPKTICLNPKSI